MIDCQNMLGQWITPSCLLMVDTIQQAAMREMQSQCLIDCLVSFFATHA